MPVIIAVAGFLGSWLLVAGPVYQAAVELDAEEVDRAAIAAADETVPPRRAVPRRWWLLPPLALLQRRRATQEHRRAVPRVMSGEQVAQLLGFGAKATGWLIVALGAALIGVKETWELVELLEWPVWAFVALLAVALLCALSYGPLRLRRDHTMMGLQVGGTRDATPVAERASRP